MALGDWGIVMRSVRARSLSSVTTMATVGIAVGLMVLIVSMRASGREAFSRGTGNAQMVISRDPSALTAVLNNLFYADAPGIPIPWSDYEGLVGSYPLAWAEPTVMGDSYRGHHVVGVRRSFFVNFAPSEGGEFALSEGRLFSDDFELVVGAVAARMTGIGVGDRISVAHGTPRQEGTHTHDEYEYEVVGVLGETGSAHDRALFSSMRSVWLLHANDRIMEERGGGERAGIGDLIEDDLVITGVLGSVGPRTAALNQILSALRRDPDWTVAQPADTVRRLFSIVGSVDQILVAMAGAVMLSSGVSIMVALANSMGMRRRQIAVLRVLGASRVRVFGLVMTESALIGLVGGVIGVGLGLAGGQVVKGVLGRGWDRGGTGVVGGGDDLDGSRVGGVERAGGVGAGGDGVSHERGVGAAPDGVREVRDGMVLVVDFGVGGLGAALGLTGGGGEGAGASSSIVVPEWSGELGEVPGPDRFARVTGGERESGASAVDEPVGGAGGEDGLIEEGAPTEVVDADPEGEGETGGEIVIDPEVLARLRAAQGREDEVEDRDPGYRVEEGAIVVSVGEGEYRVPGDGSAGSPYVLSWDVLRSVQREYDPRSGKRELPGWLSEVDGKRVALEGNTLVAVVAAQTEDMLMMQNPWDGCCIGVPPTPYDAVEVSLTEAVSFGFSAVGYGRVEGVMKVDPYVVSGWLMGLFVIEEGSYSSGAGVELPEL